MYRKRTRKKKKKGKGSIPNSSAAGPVFGVCVAARKGPDNTFPDPDRQSLKASKLQDWKRRPLSLKDERKRRSSCNFPNSRCKKKRPWRGTLPFRLYGNKGDLSGYGSFLFSRVTGLSIRITLLSVLRSLFNFTSVCPDVANTNNYKQTVRGLYLSESLNLADIQTKKPTFQSMYLLIPNTLLIKGTYESIFEPCKSCFSFCWCTFLFLLLRYMLLLSPLDGHHPMNLWNMSADEPLFCLVWRISSLISMNQNESLITCPDSILFLSISELNSNRRALVLCFSVEVMIYRPFSLCAKIICNSLNELFMAFMIQIWCLTFIKTNLVEQYIWNHVISSSSLLRKTVIMEPDKFLDVPIHQFRKLILTMTWLAMICNSLYLFIWADAISYQIYRKLVELLETIPNWLILASLGLTNYVSIFVWLQAKCA